jgi:hypothetical protein
VNQNFVDQSSHSNVLVYDDTQWVGWMDDDVKEARIQTYSKLNMGGVADWASDLQQYNDPPAYAGTWPHMILKIQNHEDPVDVGPVSGNWTSLTCTDPVVEHIFDYTPSERWARLDCNDAFSDALDTWRTIDSIRGDINFMASVSARFRATESTNCGLTDGACLSPRLCDDFHGKGTGPAAHEVWNSLVAINRVCWTVMSRIEKC